MGRRSWWQRSLDRHFRSLDRITNRKRDPEELRKEIANRIEELRTETKEYDTKFWNDVEEVRQKLARGRGEGKEAN